MARPMMAAVAGVIVGWHAAVHYIMGLWCKKLLMGYLLRYANTSNCSQEQFEKQNPD